MARYLSESLSRKRQRKSGSWSDDLPQFATAMLSVCGHCGWLRVARLVACVTDVLAEGVHSSAFPTTMKCSSHTLACNFSWREGTCSPGQMLGTRSVIVMHQMLRSG